MIPIVRGTALRAVRTQTRSSFLQRLASTLAILEQREGGLNSGSLSAVTAGEKIGGSIHGFIAGKNVKSVAEQAAKVKGLEKIIMVENEAYERGLPENYAPMLVENIKKGGYTHVIVGHSAFGKNLLPRVAALLDVQQLSDVMQIDSEDSKFLQKRKLFTSSLSIANGRFSFCTADLCRKRHSHSSIIRLH